MTFISYARILSKASECTNEDQAVNRFKLCYFAKQNDKSGTQRAQTLS